MISKQIVIHLLDHNPLTLDDCSRGCKGHPGEIGMTSRSSTRAVLCSINSALIPFLHSTTYSANCQSKMRYLLLFATILPISLALRTITIDNQCKGTIWPAYQGAQGTKLSGGPQPYGWKQPPGKYSFHVPDQCAST